MKMRSDKRELDKIFKRRDRYEIPPWQREQVWPLGKKQLLIDSILRGWRLPKFYFAASSSNPQNFDVVDGQQRLSAIVEFLSNELELSEQTAAEFGGKKYEQLPADVSDRIDDFEIDFDEIHDATGKDLIEFFQRLQGGLQLNASEKLNAIQSKLQSFCKKISKHVFFTRHVAFDNKRYAHFDVMAKVATLEVEGIGAGLRYADVEKVFISQSSFSENSQVAKRIRAALDFLAAASSEGNKTFRNRSITQSIVNMVCHLHQSNNLKGKEKAFGLFADKFVRELTEEVEKGREATDADYIGFQKSVNANVKSGPVTRHKILLRKLFQFDPEFLDLVDPQVVASADFDDDIQLMAGNVQKAISLCNEAHAAALGNDLFKPTNKTLEAQTILFKKIKSYNEYKRFIENLYFLFWEGSGSNLSVKPQSFTDIRDLRTELDHDVDHGSSREVAKKKLKNGLAFAKYAGSTSPSVASPTRFPLLQLGLLKAITSDLNGILFQFQ